MMVSFVITLPTSVGNMPNTRSRNRTVESLCLRTSLRSRSMGLTNLDPEVGTKRAVIAKPKVIFVVTHKGPLTPPKVGLRRKGKLASAPKKTGKGRRPRTDIWTALEIKDQLMKIASDLGILKREKKPTARKARYTQPLPMPSYCQEANLDPEHDAQDFQLDTEDQTHSQVDEPCTNSEADEDTNSSASESEYPMMKHTPVDTEHETNSEEEDGGDVSSHQPFPEHSGELKPGLAAKPARGAVVNFGPFKNMKNAEWPTYDSHPPPPQPPSCHKAPGTAFWTVGGMYNSRTEDGAKFPLHDDWNRSLNYVIECTTTRVDRYTCSFVEGKPKLTTDNFLYNYQRSYTIPNPLVTKSDF